jgi:predicted permease
MDILLSILPLFLIIGLGAFVMHLKVLPDNIYLFLNQYVVYVAAPSLTIVGLLSIDLQQVSTYPSFVVLNTILAIVFSIIVYMFAKRITKDYKSMGALYMTSVEGNTIYFGIPIISTFVGIENIFYIFIYSVTVAKVISFVNAYLLARGQADKPTVMGAVRDMLHNPIIIAALVGLGIFAVITVFNTYLLPIFPFIINSVLIELGNKIYIGLDKIASTTSIIALFSLGTYLYKNYRVSHYSLPFISTTLKILVYPIFIYLFVYHIFPLDPIAAKVSVLLAAMPSAIYCVVASDIFKFGKVETINSIVLSSLLFLIVFPYLMDALGL